MVQVAAFEGPAPFNVHIAELGENVPVELVEKLTVPVGTVPDEEVSVTITVQVLALLIVTELGEH
jgi:hypothetical protein